MEGAYCNEVGGVSRRYPVKGLEPEMAGLVSNNQSTDYTKPV